MKATPFLAYHLYAAVLAILSPPTAAQAQIGEVEQAWRVLNEPGIRFERLGSRDGLSHNTVLSILQDGQGFMWFGTADGLNRYDGYEFRIYRHHPDDSASLWDNTIRALAEDGRGRLWVATAGGLCRFRPAHETCVRYRFPHAGPDGSRDVRSLVVDSRGTLWAYTYGKQLYTYDAATDAMVAVSSADGHDRGLAPGIVLAPFTSANGSLWVPTVRTRNTTVTGALSATADETWFLNQYDPEDGRFTNLQLQSADGLSIEAPPTVRAGRSQILWATHQALSVVATGNAKPRLLPELPAGTSSRDFLEDRSGIVWIGTEEGVFRYDSGSQLLEHSRLDPSTASAPGNYVWQMVEDRSGIIWIATRSGLFRHDPHSSAFGHLSQIGDGTGVVMSVLEDRRGALWLGTLGSGLTAISPDEVRTFDHIPGDANSLPDNTVWTLSTDSDDALWVGTEAGLCVFEPRSQAFSRVSLPLGHHEARPAVYDIEVQDDAVWVAGDEDLYRIDRETRAVERHVNFHARSLVTLQALHVDGAGQVWIGTEGNGLIRYDPTDDRIVRYPYLAPDSSGIRGNSVWAIHADIRGRLWLGTNLGLARLDPATGMFASYYNPDVMSGAIVYSILPDDDEHLWLGSSHGLLRFNIEDETFRHFDASYGFGNTEFNRRASTRTTAGAMLFGGLEGVSVVWPDRIGHNGYEPPVVITQMFRENGDGSFEVRMADGDPVVLDHRDISFGFEFAALTYTNAHKNTYAYRLDGFDDGWTHSASHRYARYTNIPAGDYTFRVRAASHQGVWNDEGSVVRLTILPPFWQTWWFRVLAAAAVLGLISTAYRFRIAQITRMQRMRLRIAGDLHDDIGSKLSSIALITEMVRDQNELGPAHRDELSRVSTVSREMVDSLRDIVWFIDPAHERPGEFAAKLEHTARSLLPGVSYAFNADVDLSLTGAEVSIRRNLYLVYKEALHNIARHAKATNVEIDIRTIRDGVALTIKDDGVGFDAPTVRRGHGLRSMKRRAADVGALLEIRSEPGGGTSIHLNVPIT